MTHTKDEDFIIDNDEIEESESYIFDIFTETKMPNIKSLECDWKDHSLLIPKYQRNFVWSIKQASLFIESLMLNLPIPTLMFLIDGDNNKLIIDGQQRIKSILYFIGAIESEEISEREQKFNMSMPNIRYMSIDQMEEKENIFKNTVDAVVKYLGEKPFHIKNGLNSAVLDSIMVAFANNINNIPDNIYEKYHELCNNPEFYSYCDKSVNDVRSVRNRIQMADQFLFNKVTDIELKIIKLYDLPASAGSGNIIFEDNVSYTELYTSNRNADFAIRISGDSMKPDIPDGSIVLIKKQQTINSGQIGIFIYDNEIKCKKYYKKKKLISLISLNKKYAPISISSNRRIDVIGIVLDTYDNPSK